MDLVRCATIIAAFLILEMVDIRVVMHSYILFTVYLFATMNLDHMNLCVCVENVFFIGLQHTF